jgi:hypothetical protein
MKLIGKAKLLSGSMVLLPMALMGQAGGGGKSPSGPAAPASTSGLTGLLFSAGAWSNEMPVGRNQVMLCYALRPSESASTPFTLESTTVAKDDKGKPDKVPPCAAVDVTHPLLQRQTVVLVIDARKAGNISRVKVLNVNLSFTQGTPINPAQLRPSMSTSSVPALAAAGNDVYYFKWPVQLVGDSLPTLAVNAVYVAPAPGDPWVADTVYTAGSVVIPPVSNGHFYTAANEGRSKKEPAPAFTIVTPKTVYETPASSARLTWMNLGTGAPPGVATASITSWSPVKQFIQGTVLLNPINGHYYTATVGGFSGSTMPVFPVNAWLSVPETAAAVSWREVGPAPKTPPNPAPGFWTPNTSYAVGQVINGLNDHYYVVTAAGQSGAVKPTLSTIKEAVIPDSSSSLPQLTWTDLGTGTPPGVPPASIAVWAPAKQFMQGTVILYPNNGHYYAASVGGVSGNAGPVFPVTPGSVVSEPPTGGIIWEDVGTTAPSGSPTTLSQWTPSTYFATGQVISDADNGHFYLARVGGQSGTTMPTFPITVKLPNNGLISDGQIIWQDSGTIAPAAVASAGPTDQVVSLLPPLPLAQVHSLYYFNIATGFAVSSIRNPSFVRTSQPPTRSLSE